MLIKCGECGISFDHALQHCVSCGTEYQPSGDEKFAVLAQDTYAWLREKLERREVLRRLTQDCGVSDSEAATILQTARQRLKRESRQQGAYIASSGLALLVIALIVHFLSLGMLAATGCLAFGGAMVVLGLVKVATGWNITGHDDD